MKLLTSDIHIWTQPLAISPAQEQELMALLSADEILRANRFRFAHLKQRFVAAHAALRQILGLYLNLPPQKIKFDVEKHNKPCLLSTNSLSIQFNLSHSHDVAMIGVTLSHPIGIDIEKIQSNDHLEVAKRYFSPQENTVLRGLPDGERHLGFYRLWTRKEAVVKAIGHGITLPLSSFNVSLTDIAETITFEDTSWILASLITPAEYVGAVAHQTPNHVISYWQLDENGYKIIKHPND